MDKRAEVIKIDRLWQIIFDRRCAACQSYASRFLCSACAQLVELSRETGDRVYLFEMGAATRALCLSRKKVARDLLVSFICLRLDGLGWEVGHIITKGPGLALVARGLMRRLAFRGEDVLVIELSKGRLLLDRIESAQQLH